VVGSAAACAAVTEMSKRMVSLATVGVRCSVCSNMIATTLLVGTKRISVGTAAMMACGVVRLMKAVLMLFLRFTGD
jgi:hypothetical protein